MLQFGHEILLYFLWLPILVGIAGYWWQLRQNKYLQANVPLAVRLIPGWQSRKFGWEWFLLSAGIVFVMIGWSDPRMGTKVETVERKGADVVVILDLSKSMNCVDVSPSRLDLAKYKLNRLLDKLTNDRISLVFVSSRPFLQIPFTIDASIVRTWLQAADTDVLPGGGTDIGGSLLMAAQQFEGDPARDRGVVLITDGEDHEGLVEEGVKELKKAGARLYIIGVGTQQGGPIPLKNRPGQYKTDNSGQMVITKLTEGNLKRIAEQTNGQYLRWRGDDGDINTVFNGITQLDRRKVGEKVVTEYVSRGLWFVAIGLLLLLLERVLPLGRKYSLEQWRQLLTGKTKAGWWSESQP
ncbi:MAG: VWA domain-containing protein [bacterium]|nr:VWA domain-containing protein [bacterium]